MKKNDYILIGAILLVIVVVFAVFALTQEDGAYVAVKVDGVEYSILRQSDILAVVE